MTIYGGDFNTEPNSVPYKLLRAVSNLADAWVENGDETGSKRISVMSLNFKVGDSKALNTEHYNSDRSGISS